MKYIATMRARSPATTVTSLLIARAYVGISIGSPDFRGQRLAVLLHWLREHVSQSLLVIGDDLHRYTLMAERGISSATASLMARSRGDAQMALVRHQLHGWTRPQIEVIRWPAVKRLPGYSRAFRDLFALFRTDPTFRQSLQTSAREFLQRREAFGRRLRVSEGAALRLSTAYLLEELAGFSALVGAGWHVDVYPGPDLPVLEAFTRGAYSGGPPELHQRTSITLDISVMGGRGGQHEGAAC